ncbi:MAG: endonuclease/exonuclease/phosphatase family protein [Chitinophagales bacterium]
MTYNILRFPNANNNNVNGNDAARIVYFREIVEAAAADIIVIQEMTADAGATMLVNELNTNGTTGKTYARASTYTGYGGFSPLGNMLIYNTDLFNLVSQAELPRTNTASHNGETVISPRANSYYEIEAYNADCSATIPLHIFSAHLKAGSSGATATEIADRDRRNLGALDLMDFINNLPTNSNIIAGGDFNFYGATVEPAYLNILENTNSNPLFDVLNGWTRNNAANASKYTQSSRSGGNSLYGNSGAGGGLDDRFDFLFMSDDVQNNTNNVSYIANSYETFGSANIWNGDVTDGNSPIKTQLQAMSDHLPVVMELELTFPEASCNTTVTTCNANCGNF